MTGMAPQKAYSVHVIEGDGEAVILFAKSSIEARRKGASHLDCDEIAAVKCRREPWADQHADDGVIPAAAMLGKGWWFECNGCDQAICDGGTVTRYITAEDGTEEEIEVDVNPVGHQHSAYCTPECRDRDLWQRAWLKRGNRRCFEVFKRELLHRHPGVTIDPDKPTDAYWSGHHHRYFGQHSKSGRGRAICFVVCFTFPGAKYGGKYRYDLDYEGVRGKRTIFIANHDAEAWAAFCRPATEPAP